MSSKPGIPPNCGDGQLDPDELCDGRELGGGSCESLGFAGGELSCRPDCTFETTACLPLGCTDSTCDAGVIVPETCENNCDWVAVEAGGTHTCAVKEDGTAWCWGNGRSQRVLGDGSNIIQPRPVPVAGLTDVRAISTGPSHTCALTHAGMVWCWGSNYAGGLGIGVEDGPEWCTICIEPNQCLGNWCSPIPVQVPGITGIESISAGGGHTCAVDSSGGVQCWGDNEYGQVGDGTYETRYSPREVQGLPYVRSVSAGMRHTCVATDEGTIWCWGGNRYGQLGLGINDGPEQCDDIYEPCSMVPIQVPGVNDVVAVSAAFVHTCAVTADGAIWCWGYNHWGSLGDSTNRDSFTPVQVVGVTDATALSSTEHGCAVEADRTASCWGWNRYGQLGIGTLTGPDTCWTDQVCSKEAVPVHNIVGVVSVTVGAVHSCALRTTGAIWCWGSNEDGQLGTGDITGPHPCQIYNDTIGCSTTPAQVVNP
jgi:alpha-tubulin suppressor-like RCC1 family protein